MNRQTDAPDMKLFWGCFIALIATSFGFIARVLTADEWGAEFALSQTQVGEILGAGLWPFAISIILFSLVIDRVGYRAAMIFGLLCHTLSTVIILLANNYTMMYLGTFILALGSGTVEAYINPVVATMFSKDKTKWLNILHAGWPGGLALGGIIAIMMGADVYWKVKIALILIPTVVYAVMLWNKAFPTNERVAAGVSYLDMLKEVGAIGALIASTMVFMEIGRVFSLPLIVTILLIAAATGVYAYYTRSAGRPLFILFLLIMLPLATTELGVDSWITSLMSGSMKEIGIAAGWVLVYTSLIMMVLRFFAGPIVHKLSPLGLLAVCSGIAAVGLIALSNATAALAILGAATLYGIGKTFFWPTTLGIVAEQFPRGGAMTLNTVAGVGMLAVGIVGNPFLGNIQDKNLDHYLAENHAEIHDSYVKLEKQSIFGNYLALDQAALENAPEKDKQVIEEARTVAQKSALSTVAFLPILMMICYVALIIYFRSKGGYKPVELHEDPLGETAPTEM
ncbi:MAG: MFS transporter [Bacteroidetes bacterium]|nr:MAG: MFS transporter [Bacteroidota bacterium]